MITEEIKKKFFLKESFLFLDSEGDGNRAYFYMSKNYIIEKSVGKYDIHGSSLKGSKLAKDIDRAIKLGIAFIFNNKSVDEVIQEAYDFSGLGIDDFVERIKMVYS